MKVQFFCNDEPTLIDNEDLMNKLMHDNWAWSSDDDYPEEGRDGLTGEFAKVFKVHLADGTSDYVEVNKLACIANGEYEVIEE